MRMKASMVMALILACGAAQADGLAELKAALGRLQGQGMVRGTLEARTLRRLGEGKEAEEQAGMASVNVEDGAAGLRLNYGRDILARLDSEASAQVANPNAKTPTTNALREFEPSELRHMLAAAASLGRALEKASYQGEKAVTLDGRAARQLSFTVPVDTLSERQRKYIKSFQGSLEVWIASDGTPLASQRQLTASGRAFLVVGFDLSDEQRNTYATAGDRLVAVRMESSLRQSGAGERSAERNIKTLRLE